MRILIIEDKTSLREMLDEFLSEDHSVLAAENAEIGESLLFHYPNLVLCDLKLPGMSGLEFIEKYSNDYPDTFFIMMTAFGDIPTAVDAMRLGAYDFLPKPLDLNHLKFKIRKIEDVIRLKNKDIVAKDNKIIYKSDIFNEILAMARKYSSGLSPVLITGESGTGKEVVARYIHDNSSRKNEIFYSINCAAIPENLLETELFGYEQGAFTGAQKRKKGFFEIADNGTLFLDEIGDTSINFQTKLLRVIESGKYNRVGGNSEIETDIRLIFATNKGLQKLMDKELFREDLYYRISTFKLHIPPLRERKDDIRPLANYYANYFGLQVKGTPYKLDENSIKSLEAMNLPGNVRELKNYIERWVISGEESHFKHKDEKLYSDLLKDMGNKTYSEIIEETERNLFIHYLEKFNGNKQSVADRLKLNYKTLLGKLKKYKL